jgi:cell filamentation protein
VSKIETGAYYTFSTPSYERLVSGWLDSDEFVAAAAALLSDINYIHPFREGNGRTQRAFLDALAAHGGRELAWRNVSEDHNVEASAASLADPKSSALVRLLEE